MAQGEKITVDAERIGLGIKNTIADVFGDMLDQDQQLGDIIGAGDHFQALMPDVGGIFGVEDFIFKGTMDVAEVAVKQIFVDDHLQRIPGLACRPLAGSGLEIGDAEVCFDQIDDSFQGYADFWNFRDQFLFNHQWFYGWRDMG